MARVGYARVSTQDQRLDLQVDALRAAGCSRIFEEKASGYQGPRPQFDAMDAYVHEGDTLVVWKLDRLGRSTMQLMQYVNGLQERGVDFVSLQDAIDTTTPAGKFFFTVMAAFAQLEHDLIVERTNAGLAAARARGRKGGRRPIDREKVDVAQRMWDSRQFGIDEILEATGMARSTFYKYVDRTKE